MGEKGFVSPNRAPRYVQSLYFVIVMKKSMLLRMFRFHKDRCYTINNKAYTIIELLSRKL